MEFNPKNHVVQLCVKGLDKEEKGEADAAGTFFLQAWNESANDFERFIAAHFVARHQGNLTDQLKWQETALQYALKANDIAARSALPALYRNIARSYEALCDQANAGKYLALIDTVSTERYENGPFYHGTRAGLQVGDWLTPGKRSNYDPDVVMNHIYFTALISGAGLAASLAKGDGPERVYVVQPTGSFENDPNVTDKKFPGNLTRSYRTAAPLQIIGEITDWTRQSPEELQKWRDKLDNKKGAIIN